VTILASAVSVVVPTHDTRELTLACLASLAGEPAEIVLVDDASRDGTAEAVAARFPAVTVLVNPEPLGFTRSANRGLAHARSELLFLLNSDTEVAAGTVARLGPIFSADPRLGVAGAALSYPGGAPQWSGGKAPTLLWLFALASGLPGRLARLPGYRRFKPLHPLAPRAVDWVSGAAMVIRRSTWEAAGPFDPGFRFYAQDLDFCLRARRAGWSVEIRPEIAVLHHHGATIGRQGGTVRHQHPELLFRDLLRWAAKERGPRWARRAERALVWGRRLAFRPPTG
jgi:GT2 family glycosyltransferase